MRLFVCHWAGDVLVRAQFQTSTQQRKVGAVTFQPDLEHGVFNAPLSRKVTDRHCWIQTIDFTYSCGAASRDGRVPGGLPSVSTSGLPGAAGIPPVGLDGWCGRSQKLCHRTCERHIDVVVIHQCLHHGSQFTRPGEWFAVLPPLTANKELAGVLVDLPQQVNHEDRSDSVLEEPFVRVQCVPQPQYPLHVGTPISKQYLKQPNVVCEYSHEAL